MTAASILADSINPLGVRLTSWLLKYPRFIHSEIMTHRVASKNSASSRAIPFTKSVASVFTEVALPEYLKVRSNYDTTERLFNGWLQYRKTFTEEEGLGEDLLTLLAHKPAWITL